MLTTFKSKIETAISIPNFLFFFFFLLAIIFGSNKSTF